MLNTKKKKRKEKKLEITKIKKKLFIRIIKIQSEKTDKLIFFRNLCIFVETNL